MFKLWNIHQISTLKIRKEMPILNKDVAKIELIVDENLDFLEEMHEIEIQVPVNNLFRFCGFTNQNLVKVRQAKRERVFSHVFQLFNFWFW